jgi:hypothetical protein
VEIRTPDLLRPRQARYQAALRPDMMCLIHSKALSDFTPSPSHRFYLRLCTKCARMRLLHRNCAHWSRHQNVSGDRCHFVGSTVDLFQRFALHLQLHLRILLEDLRVALAEHLSHPLIGYASGTQPCKVNYAKHQS